MERLFYYEVLFYVRLWIFLIPESDRSSCFLSAPLETQPALGGWHLSPRTFQLYHCIYVLLYFKCLPLAYLTLSWNSEQPRQPEEIPAAFRGQHRLLHWHTALPGPSPAPRPGRLRPDQPHSCPSPPPTPAAADGRSACSHLSPLISWYPKGPCFSSQG